MLTLLTHKSRIIFILPLVGALSMLSTCSRTVTITRVIDGDTFVVGESQKVRLLGIDTPEKHSSAKLEADVQRTKQDEETIRALGKRASDWVESQYLGKAVSMREDSQQPTRDRSGRLLRYLYTDDGRCINLEIVREGYGEAYTKYPCDMTDTLRTLEREAREARRGLWGENVTLVFHLDLALVLGCCSG